MLTSPATLGNQANSKLIQSLNLTCPSYPAGQWAHFTLQIDYVSLEPGPPKSNWLSYPEIKIREAFGKKWRFCLGAYRNVISLDCVKELFLGIPHFYSL